MIRRGPGQQRQTANVGSRGFAATQRQLPDIDDRWKLCSTVNAKMCRALIEQETTETAEVRPLFSLLALLAPVQVTCRAKGKCGS
jgi:hypothetical protein